MLRHAPLAALAAILLAARADAQDRSAEVDRIFGWATPDTPGCAVGVSHGGRVVVNRAYGLADVERRVPLTPSTVFDIGSTQKQFVAAAVLLLAEDGRLSLADDVRRHVPELPDYGRPITLDHLLTHTGGVRDWTGLLPMAEGDPDVLTLIARQRGTNFAPGEEWAYSNSGYVLLKEAVARASGMSFAEFARRRLFEPLGMRRSAYVPDVLEAAGERALGYERQGAGWKQHMRLGNRRGGGAVVSTAADLLAWNDALTSGRLGRFVTEKLQQPATLNNGRTLTYARGLIVEPHRGGGTMVWHSGGAAGYHTWLGRFPERGLSVAVLCNSDAVASTAAARRVVELFIPPAGGDTTPTRPPAAAAAGVDVTGRAGLFFDERTGDPLRLVIADGRLRIAGGPPLVPTAADRFRPPRRDLAFRSQDDVEFRFLSPDELELRSMEGRPTRYRRAQPWSPTAAELRAADGRYRSDELGSVVEVVPGEGGVVMRFERSPEKAVALAPVARDTYMRNLMIVRLRRDAGGRVVGFDYGNPLVRGIRFARLGDRAAARAPSAVAEPGTAGAGPAPALEGLAGEYELAPGRTIAITLEAGRLHGRPPGGEKRPLTHVAGTTFSAPGGPLTLTFAVGADGRATAVVMRRNGDERTLPRVR